MPLIISLLFIGSLLFNIDFINVGYADGLFEEQLSASLGSRKADLLIKMTPPIVTTETHKTKAKNQ